MSLCVTVCINNVANTRVRSRLCYLVQCSVLFLLLFMSADVFPSLYHTALTIARRQFVAERGGLSLLAARACGDDATVSHTALLTLGALCAQEPSLPLLVRSIGISAHQTTHAYCVTLFQLASSDRLFVRSVGGQRQARGGGGAACAADAL
jgi:hypothetical protein